jgi:chemotaxis protein MotB
VTKKTFIIPSILSAALILSMIGALFWDERRQLDRSQRELAEARNATEQMRGDLTSLKEDLALETARIQELQSEKEKVTQAHNSLEQEMRQALESRDITISELKGKLTVDILDRILFDSGEALLKPEGEVVLRKIAAILADYPNRQIHIIGHTDNVPIRANSRGRFPSNWELSTARATAAVRFLSEKSGVDPRRLGAVGYGEFHPIADNANAEGRAKNRRIALVILSEELVGSDVVPGLAPPAVSESPQGDKKVGPEKSEPDNLPGPPSP